ncbi:P-loop NTPase family protein [Methylobacter psychrophilus]|uniref:hypothetical protein n=1 Tax=Methylobacter psychrophilus TaxID=96941 RepID=UPI0021D50C82|nr:hypothetical protein [Methylobacter psychrophilus]
MKTLVTANQKYGAGKTSTLKPLAFDFAQRGLRKKVCKADTKVRTLADFSDNKMESK